ncbi:hypothetical protein [Legionella fairfieldensis]|uniref:hypothetical protein n=1 Tax=Legionella fairfieldensis TaxID=45064 RepID=UPI0004914EC2|nr:hypothetical protein [Legionella fairfieldensis]
MCYFFTRSSASNSNNKESDFTRLREKRKLLINKKKDERKLIPLVALIPPSAILLYCFAYNEKIQSLVSRENLVASSILLSGSALFFYFHFLMLFLCLYEAFPEANIDKKIAMINEKLQFWEHDEEEPLIRRPRFND